MLTHLLGKLEEKKQERFEKIEAYDPYVQVYKQKLFDIARQIKSHSLCDSMTYLMNELGFKAFYDSAALESIRELYRIIQGLEDSSKSYQDNIIDLLAFSALHYSEIEQSDLFKGRIPIITVHQAKGLEFEEVFVAGCNEKVFPSYMSLKSQNLSEEMRLFYVAMTRAKEKLYLSYHLQAKKSVFVDKISEQYKVKIPYQ